MNRLQDSILKFNSREIKTLESFYSFGQGKADKKLKVLKLLKSGKKLSEKDIIRYIYGETEHGKSNFRKLIQRMEADLAGVFSISYSKKEAANPANIIQSAEFLKFIQENQADSSTGKIGTKFDFLENNAQENKSFMNQIHIGRLRNEILYFQECPFNSLDKLREAHRFSSYLTDSKIFYLGVKYYFVNGCSDKETLISLDRFKKLSAGYFEETDEPWIGFYYHLGAAVFSFLKEEYIPLSYHVDRLLLLIQNNRYLNSVEYADEIILLRFLSKEYGPKRKSTADSLTVPIEVILSNSFITRNKTRPFKLELLVRMCLNLGYPEKALQIIRMVKRNKTFTSQISISRKWDFFEVLGYYLSGDALKAKIYLNKLISCRNGLGILKFYFPVVKFILNQSAVYCQHEIEVESYKKMLYRYVRKIEGENETHPALERIRSQLLVLKQIIDSEKLSYEDCIKYKQLLGEGSYNPWEPVKKVSFSIDGIITLEHWLDDQMKLVRMRS